jgi:hypothetical protein
MAMLHVIPDERGNWRVVQGTRAAPLSQHRTATDAEVAALSYCGERGDVDVLVHDRYGRTRRPVHYGRPTAAPSREQDRRPDDSPLPAGLA